MCCLPGTLGHRCRAGLPCVGAACATTGRDGLHTASAQKHARQLPGVALVERDGMVSSLTIRAQPARWNESSSRCWLETLSLSVVGLCGCYALPIFAPVGLWSRSCRSARTGAVPKPQLAQSCFLWPFVSQHHMFPTSSTKSHLAAFGRCGLFFAASLLDDASI